MDVLELMQEATNGKYWGLPVYMGDPKSIYLLILKRVWKQIQGWKEKLLSKVGKETHKSYCPSYSILCNVLF